MSVPVPAHNDRAVAILESACRVVERDGAHGLRMASVAAAAGVSKALVHYYFATRRELLRNALAYSEERWHAAVSAELRQLPNGAERLTRMLVASVDTDAAFGEQRVLWNEVWSSLRSDDELRAVIDRSYEIWVGRIVRLIDEGRADGSIPAAVIAADAGWRLAALADGLDSMLFLGFVQRERALELLRSSIERELADVRRVGRL